jgi:hypothetical protein
VHPDDDAPGLVPGAIAGRPMRRISNLRALTLSFYSRELYREVAHEWLGAGVIYLLLVTLLSVVPALIAMQVHLTRFASREAGPILAQIPPIEIRHGHVLAAAPMPLVIRDARGGAIAILDTTGQVTSLDSTDARVLVTATHVIVRKSSAEIRTFALSRVGHFKMDGARAARWVRMIVTWCAVVVSPFVLAGLFLFRLMQVIVFAAIGALLARPLGVRLPFAPLMRLAAVAFTPVFVIDTVRGAAGQHVPLWGLLTMVIALVYLIFALQANRDPGPALADAVPPTE